MKVVNMLTRLESRMDALRRHVEALDEEVKQKLAIYKAVVSTRVMGTQDALRVEVPKP